MEDFYLRSGIYPVGFPKANIAAQAGNAVGVDATKIGGEKDGCGKCGVLFVATNFQK